MSAINLQAQADETLNTVLGMRAQIANPQFLARHTKAGIIDRYRARIEIMAAAAETLATLAKAERPNK